MRTHVWRLGLTSTRAQCDPEARGCRGPGDPSWPYARRGGTGIPVPPVLWRCICVSSKMKSPRVILGHFLWSGKVESHGGTWFQSVSLGQCLFCNL